MVNSPTNFRELAVICILHTSIFRRLGPKPTSIRLGPRLAFSFTTQGPWPFYTCLLDVQEVLMCCGHQMSTDAPHFEQRGLTGCVLSSDLG